MGSSEQDCLMNQELEDSGCVHDDSPKKDIVTETDNKVENTKNDTENMENITDNVLNMENITDNVLNMENITHNVVNMENTIDNVKNSKNNVENTNNNENNVENTKNNMENTKNNVENDYECQPNLLDLSDDVLLYILKYLSPQDLKALGFSCARLGSLVLERSLWNHVDARGTPYGKHRMRWLLQSVHSGTTQVMVTGLAGLSTGCMGHVNRTRKEVEDEEAALRVKPEPDDRHRQLYEQAVANLPDTDREELNNQPPNDEPQANFPLVRQHARMHINPQPVLDLPRISTYPSWPDDCELTTDSSDKFDKEAKVDQEGKVDQEAKVNKHTGGCPGPQFTMSSNTLTLIRDMCPRLTTLYMEYCNINCKKTNISHFPDTIKKLSLRGTRCYNLPMDKSFLFKIHDHLPKIEYLDLSECEWLEPASLLPLSKIPRLQTLLLRDCVGMTEFVAYVSLATRYGFRQLKMLDFRGCPVGDSEVSALGWLPALTELHLSPPRAVTTPPPHHHYRQETLPPHTHLDSWEMEEPDYYSQSQHDSSNSPQTSADDTVEQVERVREAFVRTFEHDMISIEVHARYAQRNDENEEYQRNRRANPGEQAGPSVPRPGNNPGGPKPGPNDNNEPGPSKRSKKDNGDNDPTNDYNKSEAGPSKRQKIDKKTDKSDRYNDYLPCSSRYFRDSDNDSNNNERFDNNNEPGPSRNNKRVQNDSNVDDSNVNEASEGGPSKRVKIDGNNGSGSNSEGGSAKRTKKDDNDDSKKNSKKCDKGKHKGGKNTRSGHEAEAPIENNDNNGERGNNNNENDYVSLSSHVQFNRNERAIYINMGESTSGVATSIKIQSDALGCMYENANEEKVTAEKSTNTENNATETKDKDGSSKEGETKNGELNNNSPNQSDSQRSSSPQPGPSKANESRPSNKDSQNNDGEKSSNPPPNDNSRKTNVSNVEVIIVQHNEPDDDLDNLERHGEPILPEEDSQESQDFAGVETVRRDLEVIIMDHNGDEIKMDDGHEADDFVENDEERLGGERIDDLNNETAERNNDRTEDDDVNNEDNNSIADNSSTNAVTIGDGSRSGSSQSTSTLSSLTSSHSSQSTSSSQTSSSSSKGSTSCTSSSSSEVSSRSSSNEELRNEEPRNEERVGSYVRFRRVRHDPPVVQHFPDHVEPRHHVLYVNLGQQLHAVYRLLPGRPFFHPRSLQRTLSTQRLEFSSLVTDSAIRRFGRAEGEDVNIIIGPNGPQFGGRDMGGRPNRSNLRILSATGYRHITNRSLIHLATSAPHLEQIDFSNTGVTAEGVENFKSIRPDCEVKFSRFKNEEEEQ